MSTITLWYYEFVSNNIGIWDRAWFASEQEAREGYAAACTEYDQDPETPKEPTGEYGDVAEPQSVEVELTAAGVLAFAQNFAVDREG